MLLCQLIVALVMCCFSSALTLKDIEVVNYTKENKKLFSYEDFGADTVTDQKVKVVEATEPHEILLVKFTTKNGPVQNSMVLLGYPEMHQEVAYEVFETNNEDIYLFEIKVGNLDKNLFSLYQKANEKPMAVTIVASNPDDAQNINRVLFYLKFSKETIEAHLLEDDVSLEREFFIKREMAHTFNEPPTQAPAVISRFFAIVILATFVVLLMVWSQQGAFNFDNIPTSNSIYFVGFIGTVIGFEYIFTQYQLGTGIFETIYKALCLGVPGIWIGAKFLRSLEKPL